MQEYILLLTCEDCGHLLSLLLRVLETNNCLNARPLPFTKMARIWLARLVEMYYYHHQ